MNRAMQKWRRDCSKAIASMAPPISARSLDLGLHHRGSLVLMNHAATCAVCVGDIPAGSKAIAAPDGTVAHVACGEQYKPDGAP